MYGAENLRSSISETAEPIKLNFDFWNSTLHTLKSNIKGWNQSRNPNLDLIGRKSRFSISLILDSSISTHTWIWHMLFSINAKPRCGAPKIAAFQSREMAVATNVSKCQDHPAPPHLADLRIASIERNVK